MVRVYCAKEITGSVRTTTNWWKHIVRMLFCFCTHLFWYLHLIEMTIPNSFERRTNEDESQQALTHLLQLQRKYNPQNPK